MRCGRTWQLCPGETSLQVPSLYPVPHLHLYLTAVGEGGAALSGGQRARVALARAVYQDCNTYLIGQQSYNIQLKDQSPETLLLTPIYNSAINSFLNLSVDI